MTKRLRLFVEILILLVAIGEMKFGEKLASSIDYYKRVAYFRYFIRVCVLCVCLHFRISHYCINIRALISVLPTNGLS